MHKKAMAEHERQKQLREQEFQRLSAKYRFLTLNSDQTRLLYSFQSMMVAFDILNTKKADRALTKSKWKDEWEASVCESLDVTRDEFFIRSGRQAFGLMEEISNDVEDRSWIDLLVLELSRFTPYYQLGLEENKSYKKLKVETDYLGDVFCKGQGYSKGIHVCDRNDNRQSKKGGCSSGSDACGHRGDCRRRIILRS